VARAEPGHRSRVLTSAAQPLLLIYPNPAALAQAAVERIVALANQAIAERGRFVWALSGGTTPHDVYVLLGETRVDWQRVYFFFCDERCVPPENEASNYGMLRATLLQRVKPPVSNVHRMQGELEPVAAAAAYEQTLRDFFGTAAGAAPPSFDLILLGMGADGHTASLFPHTAALAESRRWVVANYVEALTAWRLTLTPTLINAAKHVIFLVAGASKTARVKQVFEPGAAEPLPAQLVVPSRGELLWLMDREAAGDLEADVRVAGG
jgi:6-phosphogluconolactonase